MFAVMAFTAHTSAQSVDIPSIGFCGNTLYISNGTKTERAKLYNINRFRPQCRSCKLLPICVICIQKKIENNTCEIKKEDIDCQLRMKLMAVIEKYI